MAKKQSKKSWVIPLWSALLAYALTYAFASWAIDSGLLVPHILAYISIYYAIFFTKETIKNKFFNKPIIKAHDKSANKTKKTRTTKKAR